MRLHKKAQKDKTGFAIAAIVIIAALVIFLNKAGQIDLGALLGNPSDSGDIVTPSGGVTSVTPSFTLNCVDLHSPQTSVPCNIRYKIEDGAIQSDSDAIDMDANVGDSIEWIANATNYYHAQGKFVMPDKNTFSIPVKLLNFDTNPTIQVFNQDDGRLNANTLSEALAANNIDTLTVKIFSSFKDGINGPAFTVDYLRTNIDDITSSLGSDLVEPDSMTHNTTNITNTTRSVSRDTFRSFKIADCLNCDPSTTNAQNVEFTISVDVGSTAYGERGMIVGIRDSDWYADSSGGFSFGPEETQDNIDVGQTHHAHDTFLHTNST